MNRTPYAPAARLQRGHQFHGADESVVPDEQAANDPLGELLLEPAHARAVQHLALAAGRPARCGRGAQALERRLRQRDFQRNRCGRTARGNPNPPPRGRRTRRTATGCGAPKSTSGRPAWACNQGASTPADACVAPCAAERRSRTRTRAPRRASSYATAQPMMPAPTTTTCGDFAIAVLRAPLRLRRAVRGRGKYYDIFAPDAPGARTLQRRTGPGKGNC